MIGLTRLMLVCLAAAACVTATGTRTTPKPPPPPPPPPKIPDTKIQVNTHQSQHGVSKGGAAIHSKSKTHGVAEETAKVGDGFRRDALTKTKASQKSASAGNGGFSQVTKTEAEFKATAAEEAKSTAEASGKGGTFGNAFTAGDSEAKTLFAAKFKASVNKPELRIDVSKKVLQKAAVNQHGGSSGHGSFRFDSKAATTANRTEEGSDPPIPLGQTTTSQIAQDGVTRGGGVLSGNGTASTLAKADLDFKQAKAKLKVKFVGVSGASAGNLAAAGGKFKQTADSRSDVKLSGDSIKAGSATAGTGETSGEAHIKQDAVAKGLGKLNIDRSKGGVDDSLAAKVKAAENHGATSSFHGRFKINATAETGFKRG